MQIYAKFHKTKNNYTIFTSKICEKKGIIAKKQNKQRNVKSRVKYNNNNNKSIVQCE